MNPRSLLNLRRGPSRRCSHTLERISGQLRCRICRNTYLRLWRKRRKPYTPHALDELAYWVPAR